jgi:hypothetical protein
MKDQLGYDLIGAAMEVYNTMGSGFLEEVFSGNESIFQTN